MVMAYYLDLKVLVVGMQWPYYSNLFLLLMRLILIFFIRALYSQTDAFGDSSNRVTLFARYFLVKDNVDSWMEKSYTTRLYVFISPGTPNNIRSLEIGILQSHSNFIQNPNNNNASYQHKMHLALGKPIQ